MKYSGPTLSDVKVKKPVKVLILGSGGLSIGQAGEFDYSGSQVHTVSVSIGMFTLKQTYHRLSSFKDCGVYCFQSLLRCSVYSWIVFI